jgi:hypothetical protein
MNEGREPFVHILLFRCPRCAAPISLAAPTEERNLEETDARSFEIQCSCGWSGFQSGLDAKRHWAEPWR